MSGDHFNEWVSHVGEWGAYGTETPWYEGICARQLIFPPGWGGDITDSWAQGALTSEAEAARRTEAVQGQFVMSIGSVEGFQNGRKQASIRDSVTFIVARDMGASGNSKLYVPWNLAYPEMCVECCGGGWHASCPWSEVCSLDAENSTDGSDFLEGQLGVAKRFTRHLGGVNIGFADGHARWYNSELACKAAYDGELEGGLWGSSVH
ncbi:MAG: hypothetical protein GTN78_07830 [Gemmatimonadales bacterium]|nr:hypothetical protein [Gemmatimonadales bacterium]